MNTKLMLIISILLFLASIIILWKDNNNAIGTVLLMISILLNVIRGLVDLWNKRRIK